MVLECTMICLDNSEWMRNGDYIPSRLEAQHDAASLLCNDRTRGNPENTVGVLAMAGQGVDLLVSPTEDVGKILAAFARVRVGGKSDFATSVQIAQLALKHRKNKNGGQRIIVFVGSPIVEDTPILKKIGTQLKKNNVAVDVVNLGDIEDNNEKLLEFINSVNSGDNSRLISVPPGVLPLDAINSSPLMHGGMTYGSGSIGGDGGSAGGGDFTDYGGVDPSIDPELAMALRASVEEARANAEAMEQAAIQSSGTSAPSSSSYATPAAHTASDFGGAGAMDEEDEEALMRRALELSMLEISGMDSGDHPPETGPSIPAAGVGGGAGEDDEEESLRLALEMSLAPDASDMEVSDASPPSASAPAGGGFIDPAFVSQLLGSVDVDVNDPLIQAALAQLTQGGTNETPNGAGPGGTSSGGNSNDHPNTKKRKGGDDSSA